MGMESSAGAVLVCALGCVGFASACTDAESGRGERDTKLNNELYAMMIQVYDNEARDVYVSLSDTLDIRSTALDEAREFPSVANFAAINGKLLVSSGLKPEITEYEISSKHEWKQDRTVSFAEYPLPDNANFYAQFVVDPEHALLPFEGTKRILWNPSTMEIERTLEDSSLPSAEAGMTLEAGGNRNSVHYDRSVMQSFFYHDEDWYDYGEKSHVVVYDPKTFAEHRVTDIPCPALSLATRDEAGDTYFATWSLSYTSLLEKAPPMCIAKLDPEGELIETINPLAWTDGRAVNNFRYIGGGKAVANVLHHEDLGVSSPAKLDAEQLEELDALPVWKLWLFDVEKGRGAPIEGIDVAINSGAQFAVLEGRTFVFVPYDEWARTKAYELHDDGTATVHFDTPGDVFKWVRVR